jgi:hypothetical protein
LPPLRARRELAEVLHLVHAVDDRHFLAGPRDLDVEAPARLRRRGQREDGVDSAALRTIRGRAGARPLYQSVRDRYTEPTSWRFVMASTRDRPRLSRRKDLADPSRHVKWCGLHRPYRADAIPAFRVSSRRAQASGASVVGAPHRRFARIARTQLHAQVVDD